MSQNFNNLEVIVRLIHQDILTWTLQTTLKNWVKFQTHHKEYWDKNGFIFNTYGPIPDELNDFHGFPASLLHDTLNGLLKSQEESVNAAIRWIGLMSYNAAVRSAWDAYEKEYLESTRITVK